MRATAPSVSVPGTGRSLGAAWAGGPDAGAAGARAAREALEGHEATLLLVFAAPGRDVAAAVAGASAVAGPEAMVLGGTTAPSGLEQAEGQPVQVIALGGESLTVSAAAATGDLREAAAQAAACIGDVADCPHQLLLLFTDPDAGDPQEAVRGAYSVVGAGVPLVGGGVAPGSGGPTLLHGGELESGTVVAAALGSRAPIGVGVQHGWRVAGEPLLVTRVDGRRVLELDGRPALDAYLDRLKAPRAVRDDREAVLALSRTHPLGVTRRSGEAQVRAPVGVDLEDRSLSFLAQVAPGAMVSLLRGGSRTALAATDRACADALAALGGAPAGGLLAFSCPDRCAVLGTEGTRRAWERVLRSVPGLPVGGFATRGQIARTHGLAGLHQHALVAVAFA